MPRLIINADDFGLTSGVNQAIGEAHRNGVVTSATLMANSHAFDGAVELASAMPKLSVGCHVVLVDGQPISRPELVSTLIAPHGRESMPFSPLRRGAVRRVAATVGPAPRFNQGFAAIAKRSWRGKLSVEEVEEEATAQIRRLQAAGISVSHIDSHKHIHMLPKVADALIRAAQSCGVPAIRNPFVPVKPLALAHLLRRPKLWTRYGEVKVLKRFQDAFRQKVKDAGMATPDGSFGVVVTGALDEDLFRAIIGCIPEGTWEFVCHPGYNDDELANMRTRLRGSREKELQVLTSPAARQILDEHHVELISYRDLATSHPAANQ